MKKSHIIPLIIMLTTSFSCDYDNGGCSHALFPMDIEYMKNVEYDIHNVGIKVFLGLFSSEGDRDGLNAVLFANDNGTLDIDYYTSSTILKVYNSEDLSADKFIYDIYNEGKKEKYFFRGNEYIRIPKSTFKNEEGIITITFMNTIITDGIIDPDGSCQGVGFWYEKRPNSKIRFREVKDSDIKRNYIFGRLK